MNVELMKQLGLEGFTKFVEEGRCPSCFEYVEVEKLRDPLSIREHEMSGMCQACQDSIFGKPLTQEDIIRMEKEWQQ